MLALPDHGFVLLSLTKSGSTSLDHSGALKSRASITLRRDPRLKHVTYRQFEEHVVPLLALSGYPRESYEVVTIVRDPVDWLVSWWRYRSRPGLEQGERRHRWTGDMTFAEFAHGFLDGRLADDPVDVRPAAFVAAADGTLGVDRLFALPRQDLWAGWLGERIGKDLEVPHRNTSRERRDPELTDDLVAALTRRMQDDVAVWRLVAGSGEWSGDRDRRPVVLPGA